jgi:hypothetical protein
VCVCQPLPAVGATVKGDGGVDGTGVDLPGADTGTDVGAGELFPDPFLPMADFAAE